MAGYYNTIVQQIRERADIVALIGRHVPLKRAGASFKGCCPFHQEKTPSFFVHPDKQFYYCFGCQAKGDIFGFLMDYEGKRFPEVLKDLADEFSIELPETPFSPEVDHEEDQRKEKLYQINHWARTFFIEQLQTDAAYEVRKYIQDRGISDEMVHAFGIGYAPDDWGKLTQFYQNKNIDLELCCEVGLLKQAEHSDRIYDRFRHRLIFPILLSSGRVAGFGGRILRDDDGAKYLNSPESIVFKKSHLLYGIDLAAQSIRRNQLAILVEGYLDVIAMHQYGFTHTIAALGTALTEDHIYQLKRHTKRVLLFFDGDKAGRKAAERALQILLPGGLSVDILTLPEGDDPDTFLQTHGRDAMEQWIEKHTEPAFDFWLNHLRTQAHDDPVLLRDATQRILELLQKLEDPILRDLYIKRTAERLGIAEVQLRRGLMRIVPRPSATSREAKTNPSQTTSQEQTSPIVDTLRTSEQRTLASMIKIILENPDLFSFVEQAEFTHKLYDPLLREVWAQLIADLQEGGEGPSIIKNVLESLGPMAGYQQALAQSLMKDKPFAADTIQPIWFDLSRKLEHLQIQRKLQELSQAMLEASQQGNQEMLHTLFREKEVFQKKRLEWKAQTGHFNTIQQTASSLPQLTLNTKQTNEGSTQQPSKQDSPFSGEHTWQGQES